MKAQVTVRLKQSVLDPQGKAILGAIHSLGLASVTDVRQGKIFDIELNAKDKSEAEMALKNISKKLLANTVIEGFEVRVL